MNKTKRLLVAGAMMAGFAGTLTAPAVAAPAPADDASIAAVCGKTYTARTSWATTTFRVTCKSGKITVRGTVTDTKADGKCVRVSGKAGNKSFRSGKACPKGTSKSYGATGTGNSVRITLERL
ncbi:hypothetical protein [Saccharopolyspora gregorii]|uniref:Uncharacterized protein n=1 Tax=Saccharopolyspora gregorii TaxID=33914 RepID=A0ABP6S2L5_9PSEU|nr:hypothetical protein [Saccharopolyspora gregorii]